MFSNWKIKRENLSTGSIELLKWIGITLMFLDHFVKIFEKKFSEEIFYLVTLSSRVVFPLFIFLITWNYLFNTRNKKNYLMRLWIFALLSQPFYYFAFENTNYSQMNIFIDLALGLSFIYLMEKTWHKIESIKKEIFKTGLKIIFVYFFIILNILFFFLEKVYDLLEYSFWGIWTFLAFYFLIKGLSRNKKKLWQIIFSTLAILLSLFFLNYQSGLDYAVATLALIPLILPAFLIKIKIKRMNKYFFYLFYPLHFLLIKTLFLFFS